MRRYFVMIAVALVLVFQSTLCFASWFDGVEQSAIDWIKKQAKSTIDFDITVKSRQFEYVKVNINFDAHMDSFAVKIIDLDTGQVVAQYVDGQWKTFTKSKILSDLNTATPLEDITITTTTTTTTTSSHSTAFTTTDADENKAPLVSSETPVSSADRTGLRLMENVILPKSVTPASKERTAELAAGSKPKLIGGSITYEDFEYFDIDGSTVEIMAGLEKDFEQFTLGVIVPVSFVDITGGDWKKLGATCYAKKNFSSESCESSLGFNVALEQTWMGVSGIEDSLAYGAGPMGSVVFSLQQIEISLGGNLLYMANTEYDSVSILTAGLNAGIPFGQNFVLNAYGYRNENFDSDSDYWVVGATGEMMVSDVFAMNLGINTVTSYANYDSIAYYLGGTWRY